MSTFGRLFRVTTFGESHGAGVGCIIDGVPPLLQITKEDIQYQLDRRKPNQNSLLTTRNEPDIVEIFSGIKEDLTLGTPICLMVRNIDMKPEDYKKFSSIPRPGHADLTYLCKYGVASSSGGGRASARETIARVASGAVAEKYLKDKYNVNIISWVNSIGDIEVPKEIKNEFIKMNGLSKKLIDQMGSFKLYHCISKQENDNISDQFSVLFNEYFNKFYFLNSKFQSNEISSSFVQSISDMEILIEGIKYEFKETINIRCPCPNTGVRFISLINEVKSQQDSIGGVVSCVIKNPPRSLGEPCFDKFEAELAKAMLSIPATKGFELGSGFAGTRMRYVKKIILEDQNIMTYSLRKI
jgi:chorismate synthase